MQMTFHWMDLADPDTQFAMYVLPEFRAFSQFSMGKSDSKKDSAKKRD